ncbi:MAG TPA: GTPase Era [Phnomibacter sp.]|nr:GTPase Era [Phnomibacter sp.]
MASFKSGFVSILGKPNAGKSTLLNALVGEKMAIVSHKVQTTRHRIKAFLNSPGFQIIFSDTPGIINPEYRLHHKMMQQVKNAMEDADAALLVYDLTDGQPQAAIDLFNSFKLKVPCLVLLNKADKVPASQAADLLALFEAQAFTKKAIIISALQQSGLQQALQTLVDWLPEGPPFYDAEDLSDLPTRFFVSELIREKIYEMYHEEIPYHTAVVIQEFTEKTTLIKIRADIVVQRETQKLIIIGEKGKLIKKLGTDARQEIEKFLGAKVFLELFVKVRPKWRDTDIFLREYGYDQR